LAQREGGELLMMTSDHTKVDYYQFFRDVCSHLVSTPGLFQFGGPGAGVIQIDESVITKPKYNRGRVIAEKWVLGIYDTLLKRGQGLQVCGRQYSSAAVLVTFRV